MLITGCGNDGKNFCTLLPGFMILMYVLLPLFLLSVCGMVSTSLSPSIQIREATNADMAAIHAIYAYWVTRSCASFEEVSPSVEEMIARRAAVLGRGLPYLVADCDNEILGYSYAGPFRPRSAYRYTLEDSIYVAPFVQRRGVGGRLLAALIERCSALGYHRMIGVIGDSANTASIGLHHNHGFRQEGILRGVGLKFGKWVDVVIMHRSLQPDDTLPPSSESAISGVLPREEALKTYPLADFPLPHPSSS